MLNAQPCRSARERACGYSTFAPQLGQNLAPAVTSLPHCGQNFFAATAPLAPAGMFTLLPPPVAPVGMAGVCGGALWPVWTLPLVRNLSIFGKDFFTASSRARR